MVDSCVGLDGKSEKVDSEGGDVSAPEVIQTVWPHISLELCGQL